MNRRKAAQQVRQVLPHGLPGPGRTDRRGHRRLVDRRHAAEQRAGTGRQGIEAPAGRLDPAALPGQHPLPDAIGNMHGMPPTQQADERQRSRRFVRIRSLQHQHRAVVGQAPDLRDEPHRRRGMQVQGVVGGVAGDDGRIHAQRDRPVDRRAKAAIGLDQRTVAVMQVREVCNADHAVHPHDAACSSVSILSR